MWNQVCAVIDPRPWWQLAGAGSVLLVVAAQPDASATLVAILGLVLVLRATVWRAWRRVEAFMASRPSVPVPAPIAMSPALIVAEPVVPAPATAPAPAAARADSPTDRAPYLRGGPVAAKPANVRSLAQLQRHSSQGHSAESYVRTIVTRLYAASADHHLSWQLFPDTVVEGKRVGDVDCLIRHRPSGRAVLLEVKTTDPRDTAAASRARTQAARAAEALRVSELPRVLEPTPVVVYVDREKRFDAWKRTAAAQHPVEAVYARSPVHSVGAANLRKLLRELLP